MPTTRRTGQNIDNLTTAIHYQLVVEAEGPLTFVIVKFLPLVWAQNLYMATVNSPYYTGQTAMILKYLHRPASVIYCRKFHIQIVHMFHNHTTN